MNTGNMSPSRHILKNLNIEFIYHKAVVVRPNGEGKRISDEKERFMWLMHLYETDNGRFISNYSYLFIFISNNAFTFPCDN